MFTLLDKFMGYIAAALAAIVVMLSIMLFFKSSALETCQTKLLSIQVQSKSDKARYDSELVSYDDAIKSIVKFYEKEIVNINDFKRGDHETECEAAYRLLNNFRY